MTISGTLYFPVLVALIAIIVIGFYWVGKRKKNNLGGLGVLIAIVLVVVNKWIFPYVYTVSSCGEFEETVMLVPYSTSFGNPISYGKHCYLINESESDLGVTTIFYGNKNEINSTDEMIEDLVPAKSGKQFDTVQLDYIFEQGDKEVSSKRDGEVKYAVYCTNK